MCGARVVEEDAHRDVQCENQEGSGSMFKVMTVSPARFANTRQNSQGPGWMELNL